MNTPNTRYSYIFQTIIRVVFFFVNLFAVYLLLRGHNFPGGGFIAGVATALSLALAAFAIGLEKTRRILKIDPARFAIGGLSFALMVAVAPMFFGSMFFEHPAWKFAGIHLATFAFDVGVYLVVVGVTAKIIFTLAASVRGDRPFDAHEQALYSSVLERPVEDQLPEEQLERSDHHAI